MSSVESLFSPTSLFMSGMASQLQAKAMKKLDTDADGNVTQTEFQAVLEKAAGKLGVELGEGEAAGMFSNFDGDADGSLNLSEVGNVVGGLLSSLGNVQDYMKHQHSGFSADSFASRDADGDGVLSLAEFTGEAARSAAPIAYRTVTTQTVETTVLPQGGMPSMPGIAPISTDTGAVDMTSAVSPTGSTPVAAADNTTTAGDSKANTVESLMASLDANKDGQISGEELSALVNRIETVVQRYNETALAKNTATATNPLV